MWIAGTRLCSSVSQKIVREWMWLLQGFMLKVSVSEKNEAPKFCGVIISHFCLLVCKSLTKRRRSDDVFFVPQRAEVPGRATLLDHVIQLLAPTSLCNGFKFWNLASCVRNIARVCFNRRYLQCYKPQLGTRDESNEPCLKRNGDKQWFFYGSYYCF